jgi:hypothetical protein
MRLLRRFPANLTAQAASHCPMRAASHDLPMPPLFRRLLLLYHALRFGARLIWLAAPREHKLHWMITLVKRVHATEGGRNSLHSMLPALGPLASNFVQTLAERPELATGTLHDTFDAIGRMEEPLPPEQVEAALAGALGRPLTGLFAQIDLIPAKSGFAEQTHVARLAVPVNGHRDIAIKFVRAAQIQQIGDELALLRWVARWLEKLSGSARRLQVRALAQSFTEDVLRRFDLRAEAANLSQTGHHFEGDKRLAVPEVIWELCSTHTLAVQHIETLAATDLPGLLEHRVKLAALATHLVEVVTEQAFEHGFFHATFDSAHVRVSIEPDTLGRIVLAEFAAMSSLSSHEREFFVHGATALFDQDYARPPSCITTPATSTKQPARRCWKPSCADAAKRISRPSPRTARRARCFIICCMRCSPSKAPYRRGSRPPSARLNRRRCWRAPCIRASIHGMWHARCWPASRSVISTIAAGSNASPRSCRTWRICCRACRNSRCATCSTSMTRAARGSRRI